MPILMRRLNGQDVAKLAGFFIRNNREDITSHFRPFPLSSDSATALLAIGRRDCFFIMEDETDFLAFAMLRGSDEGYVIPSFGIFVDIEYHGRGYGQRLTEWVLRWADHQGVEKIRLTVFENNGRAMRLYEKLGFSETGRVANAGGKISIIMHRRRDFQTIPVFASTHVLSEWENLPERLRQWADAGIFNIELSNYSLDSEDDFFKAAASFPGNLMLHHFFPAQSPDLILNLASPSPARREETLIFFKRSIEWSARIKAPFFSLHAGYITDPAGRDGAGFVLPPADSRDYEIAWSFFLEGIRTLARFADQQGIILLIENNVVNETNRDKLLLSCPEEFERFFNKENMPQNVGILLDWGHWLVSAKTYGCPLASILRIKDRVYGLHLHENDGLSDAHLPFSANSKNLPIIRQFRPKFVTLEGRCPNRVELQNHLLAMERIFP